MKNVFGKMNEHVSVLNNSKLFAGLMIIILNIASKFVTIKLSKTVESYLKYTFSKQILVFAMAWMGTRDIYIALFITIVFTICIEFLFNEESQFCLLPESFTDYHLDLLDKKDENNTGAGGVSNDDLKKAKDILEKLGVTLRVDTLVPEVNLCSGIGCPQAPYQDSDMPHSGLRPRIEVNANKMTIQTNTNNNGQQNMSVQHGTF